jgi:hypothetical protein
MYGFCNKLEHLSLKNRLGWKGLPGTNTNLLQKLYITAVISFMIQTPGVNFIKHFSAQFTPLVS